MNPIISLIIANIIWGAAAPIFKYSLTNIPPFTLAFIRFFFAALLFLPFVKLVHIKQLTRKDWIEILVASFFGITVNISFFFLGLEKTTSINAPVIASTGPLLMFILSVIFLKEKMHRKVLLGMTIAFIGVMVIVFSPILFDGYKKEEINMFQGNLMLLVATLGSVINPLVLKNVLKRISPITVTAIGFFFSSFTFLPFMLHEFETWNISQLNTAGWIGILFGVFLSSALAYFLFYDGLSKIAAQEVGVFTYIDPIVAVLIAIPLLHEFPNLYFILGSTLIFGGIYVSEGRLQWHPIRRLKVKN